MTARAVEVGARHAAAAGGPPSTAVAAAGAATRWMRPRGTPLSSAPAPTTASDRVRQAMRCDRRGAARAHSGLCAPRMRAPCARRGERARTRRVAWQQRRRQRQRPQRPAGRQRWHCDGACGTSVAGGCVRWWCRACRMGGRTPPTAASAARARDAAAFMANVRPPAAARRTWTTCVPMVTFAWKRARRAGAPGAGWGGEVGREVQGADQDAEAHAQCWRVPPCGGAEVDDHAARRGGLYRRGAAPTRARVRFELPTAPS